MSCQWSEIIKHKLIWFSWIIIIHLQINSPHRFEQRLLCKMGIFFALHCKRFQWRHFKEFKSDFKQSVITETESWLMFLNHLLIPRSITSLDLLEKRYFLISLNFKFYFILLSCMNFCDFVYFLFTLFSVAVFIIIVNLFVYLFNHLSVHLMISYIFVYGTIIIAFFPAKLQLFLSLFQLTSCIKVCVCV